MTSNSRRIGTESPAQAFTSEDAVPNARGRVLGGSSTINAGFYSLRADQDFYAKSALSWDLTLVNQSYEWVESAIVFRPEWRTWQSTRRDSLLEEGKESEGYSIVIVSEKCCLFPSYLQYIQ